MEHFNYEDFYNRVGAKIGWNFSQVKCVSEEKPWNFYDEVKNYCSKNHILLDIGTGGGEQVLKIASAVLLLVGIDKSTEMIKTANNNLAKTEVSNVKFFNMAAENIEFPNNFFNVISCQHSGFDTMEVFRLLDEHGVFLTQQVSEADKLNIKDVFHRGQNYGKEDGIQKKTYIHELKETGFTEIKSMDYDVKEYYQTPEDLIFILKHTPIIPNFGNVSKDFEILQGFIEKNRTEKGICTNSKRYMIVAKKERGYRPWITFK